MSELFWYEGLMGVKFDSVYFLPIFHSKIHVCVFQGTNERIKYIGDIPSSAVAKYITVKNKDYTDFVMDEIENLSKDITSFTFHNNGQFVEDYLFSWKMDFLARQQSAKTA
jgi:hypothetical protein